MQMNFIDFNQLAELLVDGERLQTIDHGSQRIHVMSFGGSDLITVVDPLTGSAICIYSCNSFDVECGGSIHDQARAILAGNS